MKLGVSSIKKTLNIFSPPLRLSFITLIQSAVRGSFSATISEIQSLHSCQSFKSASRSSSVSTVWLNPSSTPSTSRSSDQSFMGSLLCYLSVPSASSTSPLSPPSCLLGSFSLRFSITSPFTPHKFISLLIRPVLLLLLHRQQCANLPTFLFRVLTAQWRLFVKVKKILFCKKFSVQISIINLMFNVCFFFCMCMSIQDTNQ